jgi:hypothetical protein
VKCSEDIHFAQIIISIRKFSKLRNWLILREFLFQEGFTSSAVAAELRGIGAIRFSEYSQFSYSTIIFFQYKSIFFEDVLSRRSGIVLQWSRSVPTTHHPGAIQPYAAKTPGGRYSDDGCHFRISSQGSSLRRCCGEDNY